MHGDRTFEFQQHMEYNICRKGLIDVTGNVYALDEIRKIAYPIAQKYGIAALYLFGSYARGEATPESDIDFRVDRGDLVDLLELGGLFSDLEEAFQKKLHVVTTQMLSPAFLSSIKPEEILIYQEEAIFHCF